MKLLLIEDEPLLVETLSQQLTQAGFSIESCFDGEEAEYRLNEFEYDLIILDLGLPKKPGLVVLEHFRAQKKSTPVLILTARNAWQERVQGLKSGADDYLGKPFHFEELLARIQVLLKRHYSLEGNRLTFGDFQLDLLQKTLIMPQQQVVSLTRAEFLLLEKFFTHPDRIYSKQQLFTHIAEEDKEQDLNLIEVYIHKLRKYLGKQTIKTLRGQGYQLVHTQRNEAK